VPGWMASLVAVVLVVMPLAGVAVQAWREWMGGVGGGGGGAGGGGRGGAVVSLMPSWGLLGNTLAWSVGIGVAAAVLAWPAAWVVRRVGVARAAWILVPLAMPAYFVYAGFGLLRAPGTVIGNWVEGLVGSGWTLAPLVASRVVAVVGLVLWAWPVAAMVMGGMLRRVDEGVLEQARVELGTWDRARLMLRLGVPAFVAGAGLVALLMVGSAVPLHVSQTPTYAIRVWFEMTLRPGSALVWVSAWPILVVAIVAGWVIGSRLEAWTRAARRGESLAAVGGGVASGNRGGGMLAMTFVGVVMVLSVGLPAVMFVLSVREWASVGKFWALHGEAMRDSLMVAAAVGVGVAGVAVVVWRGMQAEGLSGRVTGWSVRLLLVAGLLPGVLVGLAWVRAAALGPEWFGESVAILVLAHLTRYGFLGAMVGCWLAASEARGLRELRRLDGVSGWWGWWRTSGLAQGGVVVAVGVLGGALSVHEIEANVVVSPVYVQSLAQAMLGYLHFARMEELSVGSLLLLGVTAGALCVGGAVVSVTRGVTGRG
jgi:ABC-type Fe3+ transport system permease subunit